MPTCPEDDQYSGPTALAWAADGYAVAQLTARGWGNSCGTAESRAVDPVACAKGYLRLADVRYEVRDVQNLIGLMVDEGVADSKRIGVTGESYGGGTSLALATLKDRVMAADGSLKRWTSPEGTPLSITAAAPMFAWSDMAYALMPNGRTLDTTVTSAADDLSPIGVWKQSIDSGLFLVGDMKGYYAPPDVDPQADVRSWFAIMGAGDPYHETEAGFISGQVARFHSPYYLLAGAYGVQQQAPAPLLIAAGFTDDVFPVDEALRYYNLQRELYPRSPIALFLYAGGHQRAQNKPADGEALHDRIKSFFEHYLRGMGDEPESIVTARSQTCPETEPSGGPYEADSWQALHPGEVRFASKPSQTIHSDAGDDAVSKAFDPIAGGLACSTAPAADQGVGVATYRLPPATGSGYTLLGAPTVTAELAVTGEHAYVAARLVDVDPSSDTETLVARGVYRVDPKESGGRATFQLHPNAWHFAAGHVAKLELLGRDAPYLRPSGVDFSFVVSDLELRLPVHEVAGAAGTPAEVRAFTEAGRKEESPSHRYRSGQASSTVETSSIDSIWPGVAAGLAVIAVVTFSLLRRRRTSPPEQADGGDGGDDGEANMHA